MSETLKAVERELTESGIQYDVNRGKRHYKVKFKINGESCTVSCSVSPSDHRAALNARLQVRKRIRQALGL